MHILADFVPGDDDARSVRTEDRGGRISLVTVRIIADLFDHRVRILTRTISSHLREKVSLAFRVGGERLRVVSEYADRRLACQDRVVTGKIRL